MAERWDTSVVRSEVQMRRDLDKVLQEMRRVLDATRMPRHAADVPHTYTDKYAAVERATQAALVSQVNVLCDGFGLSPDKLHRLAAAARAGKTVTLRFDQSSTCQWVTTLVRDEEDPHRVEKRGLFGTTTYKRITRIVEHVWRFKMQWRVSAYIGAFTAGDADNTVELKKRYGRVDVRTRVAGVPLGGTGTGKAGREAQSGPLASRSVADPVDVDITWLLDTVVAAGGGDDGTASPDGAKSGGDAGGTKAAKAAAADDGVPTVPRVDTVPIECPKGHPLARFLAKDGTDYVCDGCGMPQHTGAELFSCRACDYDLCPDCAASSAIDGGDDESVALAVVAGAAAPPPGRVAFRIRRSDRQCHTPSNNADVARVATGAAALARWTGQVDRALVGAVRMALLGGVYRPVPNLQYDSVANDVFNPVLAFLTLEDREEAAAAAASIAAATNPSAAMAVDSSAAAVAAESPSLFLATGGGGGAGADAGADDLAAGAAEAEATRLALGMSPATQLSHADFDALVNRHRGTLRGKFEQLRGAMPRGELAPPGAQRAWPPPIAAPGILTTAEGEVRVACAATLQLWRAHADVVRQVEDMLRAQLVQAIGSVVTAAEFAEYMEYHKRSMFRREYCPRPFSYAVRRPDHYPEGIISVESDGDAQPVTTTVVHRPVGHTMKLPLGASIAVELKGEHYVHAQVLHQFSCRPPAPDAPLRRVVDCPGGHGLLPHTTPRSGVNYTCDRCRCSVPADTTMYGCRACNYDACTVCRDMGAREDARALEQRAKAGGRPATAPPSSLIARARQFSSFVLVLGSLSAADEFLPTNALILQNKDAVKIPLVLTTIPTPKEFARSVSSLSPEQQAFAKAYRQMQLAGTLFAVAVIQIKPNLERLLNLPADALTKQVKLGQDLMRLFLEFQIPSDLLSYSGEDANASASARVRAVKAHVAKIDAVIAAERAAELEEARRRAAKRALEERRAAKRALEERRLRERQEMERTVMREELMEECLCDFEAEDECDGAMLLNDCSDNGKMNALAECSMASSDDEEFEDKELDASSASCSASCSDGGGDDDGDGSDTAGGANKDDDGSDPADGEGGEDGTEAVVPVAAAEQAVQDYTLLPHKLNANFDALDIYDALRPTKIAAGDAWRKTEQDGLLSAPKTRTLDADAQRNERSRAFDLLDALSRSGAMPLEGCTLHVMVAATHCFDRNLMDTLVKDNVDPITRAESSELIMAATLHGEENVADLVRPEALSHVEQRCPQLLRRQ